MSELDEMLEWPPERMRLASFSEVHAFGQISLIYNYLESSTGNIFGHYMPHHSVSLCDSMFHRLNNADRVFLLYEMLEEREKDGEVKAAVAHYLNCYDISTENRNTLAHASIEVRESPDMLPISKRSKSSKVIFFHLSLSDLRGVANEMGEVFDYATRLLLWLYQREKPTEERAKMMGWPWAQPPQQPPLPNKPPKPRKLIQSQPLAEK